MKRSTPALAGAIAAILALSGPALAQATITVVNGDGPNEGFNDATAVAPVAGNAGTTLGAQRLNAFQAAANDWGATVSSSIEIRITANMDPLTPCSASSGVLGRAGPTQAFRDFTNAPKANTFYPVALANAIANIDLSTAMNDLVAQFNSDVDDNPGCLSGTTWWYGINSPAPANTISFYDTLKHEIAHGLGVLSFVDVTSGAKLGGRDDAYSDNLHDHSAGTDWPSMTNAERQASMVDDGDLHWIGPQVNNCAAQILTAGRSGGHVQMYAPTTLAPGSSVSHFDTDLAPDELMEPFATATSDQRLTDRLLADIGWNVNSPPCGPVHGPILSPHNVLLSPHHPVISRHDPRISFHHPVLSFGHGIIDSRHNPFLSNRHNLITSRHNPFLSGGHSIIASQHNPILSGGHSIIASQHNPILSGGHGVIDSQHNVIISGGGHNLISSRHNAILSGGHDMVSSFDPGGHMGAMSRFDPQGPGGFDPRNPGFDPGNPGFDPRNPGFDPRNPGFDPRMFGMDPRMFGMDPNMMRGGDPRMFGADPNSGMQGGDTQREFVPGNRSESMDVPLPPFTPYPGGSN